MQLLAPATQTPASRYANDVMYAGAYAHDAIGVIESGPGDFPDAGSWAEAVGEAIGSAASHARSAVELLSQLPEQPANADDVVRGAALLEDADLEWSNAAPDDAPTGHVIELLETASSLLG